MVVQLVADASDLGQPDAGRPRRRGLGSWRSTSASMIVDPQLMRMSLVILGGVTRGVCSGPTSASGARHDRAVRRRNSDVAATTSSTTAKWNSRRSRSPATFNEIDWITIFFFIGLFVIVHGVDVAGMLDIAAQPPVGGYRRGSGGDCHGHPVGLGDPLGDRRQHSVCRGDDPVDQGDGAASRRRRSRCCHYGGRFRWAPVSAATAP